MRPLAEWMAVGRTSRPTLQPAVDLHGHQAFTHAAKRLPLIEIEHHAAHGRFVTADKELWLPA